MKKMKKKAAREEPEETWMPIALAVICTIIGIIYIFWAFSGDNSLFGYNLNEAAIALKLVFGIIFFGTAWEFYKRKKEVIGFGYSMAIIAIIINLIEFSLGDLILWVFVLYLVHSSKGELVN